MSKIRQIIYTSKAACPFSSEELRLLVDASAGNNRRNGITGALLFVEQSFIQVIEGEEDAVAVLLTTIKNDPRHTDFRIISDQVQEGRHFSEWSMALVTPPEQDRPQVVRELRSASEYADSHAGEHMPLQMPETFEMMQHLYNADRVLQGARG